MKDREEIVKMLPEQENTHYCCSKRRNQLLSDIADKLTKQVVSIGEIDNFVSFVPYRLELANQIKNYAEALSKEFIILRRKK